LILSSDIPVQSYMDHLQTATDDIYYIYVVFCWRSFIFCQIFCWRWSNV